MITPRQYQNTNTQDFINLAEAPITPEGFVRKAVTDATLSVIQTIKTEVLKTPALIRSLSGNEREAIHHNITVLESSNRQVSTNPRLLPEILNLKRQFSDCESPDTKKQKNSYSEYVDSNPTESDTIRENIITHVLLYTQRALLGLITPNLRAVTIDAQINSDHSTPQLFINFYHSAAVSPSVLTAWQKAIDEVTSKLEPLCPASGEIIQLDFPHQIPKHEKFVFLRKEN